MLTNENYFSVENNMKYMGNSQWKAFKACESRALAEAKGDYERPMSTALLVGSYVDAHFEGTLPQFTALHPQIFKRDGNLKKDYEQANDIIARIEADRLFALLMSGKKQVIKTGLIAGVPFKIKIDSFLDGDTCRQIVKEFPSTANVFGFCDGAIVDLKCMKDLADVWDDEEHCKLPFVEAWGYNYQGAIYQAIEGNMLPFILAVSTKEPTPNIAALTIDQGTLDASLAEVEDLAPHFQEIKTGLVKPNHCDTCDWCKQNKVLNSIVNYREVR